MCGVSVANRQLAGEVQGSKIALVSSYLRVPQAAGQVEILIFLVKIIFFLYMSIIFVMQGKCLFSDISRPEVIQLKIELRNLTAEIKEIKAVKDKELKRQKE